MRGALQTSSLTLESHIWRAAIPRFPALSFRACGFAITLAALALPFPTVHAATTPLQTETFLVYVDGDHVGTAQWQWRNDAGRESYSETMTLRTTQARGRAAIDTRFDIVRQPNASLAYTRRFRAGLMSQHDAGKIVDGHIHINGADHGDALNSAQFPTTTVFPFQLIDRLRAWQPGSANDSFPFFDIRAMRTVQADLGVCPSTSEHDASFHCVAFRTHGLPAQEERWFFDAAGTVQRIAGEFGGLPFVRQRCLENCDRIIAKPMDLIGRMVVASPYRIPKSAAQRTLRYVLSRDDGKPLIIVDTGDQTVARSNGEAVVTICRQCGVTPPDAAAYVDAYLAPNPWVQSDHREVRRLAARAGDPAADVDSHMRRLVAVVQATLRSEVNYLGYTDAVQSIRNRRGGCAEFATVLAALARSQGIPARVVVGLAYSDRFSGRKEVFSPHVWVQVWNASDWVSYDAALGDFDSTHIALAVGDGNPDEVYDAFAQLPHLKIERAGIVNMP